MIEIKAPYRPNELSYKFSIFLAGSIDMGSAKDWQSEVAEALTNYRITIYNPRRDHWDCSLEQNIKNPQFREQVTWEQHYLAESDIRIFVFTDNSKAPITFFELGLFINKPNLICVEDGFYRKANIDITATLYGKPVYNTIEDMINHLKTLLDEQGLRIN